MNHLKTLNILNKLQALILGVVATYFVYLTSMALGASGSLLLAGFPFVMAVAAVVGSGFFWMLGDKLLIGKWKTLQVVIGALALLAVPVGTIYGAYAMWVCLKSESAEMAYNEMSELEIFA